MDIQTVYARARRGMREDAKLYLIAISSLTVAFLCLATALLGLANLGELAERWGRSHRMSVYLRDDAPESEALRLTGVLTSLPSVARAEYMSRESARQEFLRDSPGGGALRDLPGSAFPASIEVAFAPSASAREIEQVARKVAIHHGLVEDVDTYKRWFERVGALVRAARAIALGLGLLVGICVIAVVANTIRLAVANRREEIEVLKMCGATDAFVRAPFLLEGTLQGFCAALFSLSLLLALFLGLRVELDRVLLAFAGVRLVFLPPLAALALVVGGAMVGALGSALSVRRYVAV